MESPRSFSSKYLVQASRQVSITSLSNYQQLSYGKGMVPKSVAVTLDVDDPAMVLQTVENGIWLEVVQDLRGEPLASFEEPGNEPGAIVGQLQQKLFFTAAMGDVPDAAWNVMTKSSCTPPPAVYAWFSCHGKMISGIFKLSGPDPIVPTTLLFLLFTPTAHSSRLRKAAIFSYDNQFFIHVRAHISIRASG